MNSTYDLYLNLLRDCLLGTVYRDPPLDLWNGIVRNEQGIQVKFGESAGVMTIEAGAYDAAKRKIGADWPATALTMIGTARMDNIRHCVETVIKEGIPGDLIETGVWRGGACIFMAGILRAMGVHRQIWACDSFEGLPKPDEEKYPADKNDFHHIVASLLAVSLEEVKANLERYGYLDAGITFLKGWFSETLPTIPPEQKFALARLDGDMYQSTFEALENLYDKISPGGFCIIDDYKSVEGCHAAVEDFRLDRGITAEIKEIDKFSAFWRK